MAENFNVSGFHNFGDLQSASRASTSRDEYVAAWHDNLLPVANVGRIMKDGLPPHAKISKRAKETIQECATEFISFVTGEASERCRRERRKTVNGDDVCHAMRALGLDQYADAMQRYLQRYRESEELAASLNSGRAIQIDVRAELSVVRGNDQQRN